MEINKVQNLDYLPFYVFFLKRFMVHKYILILTLIDLEQFEL